MWYAVAPIIHVTKRQQSLQDQPRYHRGRGCHKGRRHRAGRDAIGDAQGRATVEAQPAEPKKASSLGRECLGMVGRWLRRLRVALGIWAAQQASLSSTKHSTQKISLKLPAEPSFPQLFRASAQDDEGRVGCPKLLVHVPARTHDASGHQATHATADMHHGTT